MGFYMMYGIASIMIPVVFVIVIGTIIVQSVRGVKTWNKNNHSPQLSVDAVIVSKRTQVSHVHNGNAGEVSGTSTRYFVTFEVESGDRIEFTLSGREYGMLAEGDQGKLTFQGTRYLEFERY